MVMFPSTKNTAPMLEYMGGSVSYIAAMCFANLSLQYVSYPMQALAKSCKPIPGSFDAQEHAMHDTAHGIEC